MATAGRNDSPSDSQADLVQSARCLLHLISSSERGSASGGATNQDMREQRQTERPPLQMEMTRSFPGLFTKGRGKRRFPAANLVPAKRFKPLDVAFYLLPKQCEKTPKEQEQIVHMHAGLGRRTAHLDENTTHEELCDALKVLFPKLGDVTGGWLLYKSAANSNVTRLFERQPGHLVPSASHFLVESDMFLLAGRMVGHSFLHGGPCLSGLSPAIVHVLLGGSPETATVTLEDCPDLDIRETIKLLEGSSILSDKDKQLVEDLALAWDLPSPTEKNRRWLFEKLLIHAVVGRVTRQIKQLRRGLKETPMWALVTQRPDTVALLFPKEGAGHFSPEVLLQRLTWPHEDSDDDDECSVDTKCRISGYLRQFIANATPTELTNLVKFWTGWEILPPSLSVEVVESRYCTPQPPPALRPCASQGTTRITHLLNMTSWPVFPLAI